MATKQEIQSKFETALIHLAYKKATEAAEKGDFSKLGFDVRPRAIYTLDLSEEDIKLLKNEELGFEISSHIRCNLDLNCTAGAALKTIANDAGYQFTSLKVENYMSVIPLYEELL